MYLCGGKVTTRGMRVEAGVGPECSGILCNDIFNLSWRFIVVSLVPRNRTICWFLIKIVKWKVCLTYNRMTLNLQCMLGRTYGHNAAKDS